MAPAQRLSFVSRLHAFPKPDQGVAEPTASGGAVTLLGVLTLSTLFAHELVSFLTPTRTYEMGVDTTPRGKKLPIHFDISLPAMPCQVLALTLLDASGRHEVSASTAEVVKVRLRSDGTPLSSQTVYDLKHALLKSNAVVHHNGSGSHAHTVHGLHRGPLHKVVWEDMLHLSGWDASQINAALKEVQDALDHEEGCRISGQLQAERISGLLQIAPYSQHYHVLYRVFPTPLHVNMSHTINTLGFGVLYPGIENPLDGFVRTIHRPTTREGAHARDDDGSPHHIGAFKYFLKVVPTSYQYIVGDAVDTNQYSVSEYFHPFDVTRPGLLPVLSFHYDISPITVSIKEGRVGFLHFLTRLCAVLGGAFALMGILDRLVYNVVQHIHSLRKPRMRKRRGL